LFLKVDDDDMTTLYASSDLHLSLGPSREKPRGCK
jgi:hypothetical protein